MFHGLVDEVVVMEVDVGRVVELEGWVRVWGRRPGGRGLLGAGLGRVAGVVSASSRSGSWSWSRLRRGARWYRGVVRGRTRALALQ